MGNYPEADGKKSGEFNITDVVASLDPGMVLYIDTPLEFVSLISIDIDIHQMDLFATRLDC